MQRTKQKKPTTLLLPCALSSPTNKPRPSNPSLRQAPPLRSLLRRFPYCHRDLLFVEQSQVIAAAFNLQPSLAALVSNQRRSAARFVIQDRDRIANNPISYSGLDLR
ncbi:unnamed protein product [Linum trigynum]|uniref:Uncharacterized protein n=1 Tax=Linum trigynum TaxID=586398 RepID=A0AAV2D2L0_9ROSI